MSCGENVRFVLKVWFYELPKAIVSCIIGFLIGIWPVIPFTFAIVGITLIRFPINIYKTFKVAITSVVLKWNLRIMILLILPFAHILFPIIVLIVGLFGSLGFFVGYCIACVYEGKNWLKPWKDFPKGIKEYWKAHVDFVEETVSKYDHPTGIPLNWDGTMYGFPFGPMKVIFGFILTLYGMIICGFGTFIIITIIWIPMNLYDTYHYFKAYFEQGWVKVVTLFPFFLIGLCFLVILSPVLYVLVLLIGIFAGLRCPYVGIKHDNLKFGFIESLNILKLVDDLTKDLTPWKMALSYYEEVEFDRTDNSPGGSAGISHANQVKPDFYWDIFISRCIKECANLIKKKWMSIPAVVALSILIDSAKSDNGDKEAIVWAEDVKCTLMHLKDPEHLYDPELNRWAPFFFFNEVLIFVKVIGQIYFTDVFLGISILIDSAKSDNGDKEAIVWAEDVVCTSSSRPSMAPVPCYTEYTWRRSFPPTGNKTKIELNRWAPFFFFDEVLIFVKVIGQIYFTDVFLGGLFLYYVVGVPKFWKMTNYIFHKFGGSGTIQKFVPMCVFWMIIIYFIPWPLVLIFDWLLDIIPWLLSLVVGYITFNWLFIRLKQLRSPSISRIVAGLSRLVIVWNFLTIPVAAARKDTHYCEEAAVNNENAVISIIHLPNIRKFCLFSIYVRITNLFSSLKETGWVLISMTNPNLSPSIERKVWFENKVAENAVIDVCLNDCSLEREDLKVSLSTNMTQFKNFSMCLLGEIPENRCMDGTPTFQDDDVSIPMSTFVSGLVIGVVTVLTIQCMYQSNGCIWMRSKIGWPVHRGAANLGQAMVPEPAGSQPAVHVDEDNQGRDQPDGPRQGGYHEPGEDDLVEIRYLAPGDGLQGEYQQPGQNGHV